MCKSLKSVDGKQQWNPDTGITNNLHSVLTELIQLKLKKFYKICDDNNFISIVCKQDASHGWQVNSLNVHQIKSFMR